MLNLQLKLFYFKIKKTQSSLGTAAFVIGSNYIVSNATHNHLANPIYGKSILGV
jgi:NAD/NADP transhydrogenase beta subunit